MSVGHHTEKKLTRRLLDENNYFLTLLTRASKEDWKVLLLHYEHIYRH